MKRVPTAPGRRRRAASLLLFALAAAPPARVVSAADWTAARVAIDAGAVVRTVDDRFFGLNAAIWDGALGTPETTALLAAAGVRVLRFPGGSLSDEYHWRTNTTLANAWTWPTGFDAFAGVASALGAQAFITVNYGTGTPEEAAEWVAYSNAVMGYGFRYWEIGNENYGAWETDAQTAPHDPYTYAVRARDYIAQIKAADPQARVGVVVITGEDSFANNTRHPATNPRTGRVHNGWTPVLLATLRSLGVTPDFAVYHRYEQAPGAESDAVLLLSSRTWADDARDLRRQLTDYLGAEGAAVEMVVTENNSVYASPGKQTTSLVNALFLADSVGAVLLTEFNALVWWDVRNSREAANNNSPALHGWRPYGDYGVLSPGSADGSVSSYEPYPTYYAAKLVSRFARGGDAVVRAASDHPLLAAYATLGGDGRLRVLLINRSPSATLTATLDLAGFAPGPGAETASYGIPQDEAARTGEGSPDLASATFPVADAVPVAALAPYSATVVTLAPAPAPHVVRRRVQRAAPP